MSIAEDKIKHATSCKCRLQHLEGKSMIYSMHKVGKKKAGRLLDGIEHNEFPKK